MCERPGRHVSPVGALIATSSQLLTIVAVLSSLWSFATSASHNDSQTLVCLKLHLSSSALDSWKQKDFCSWPGVTCSAASRVVALDLDSSGLDGHIPPCIGNLTVVTRIHFANNRLAGVIPPELGQLRRLRYLNLSSNNITGTIPNTLSSASLRVIDLGSNSLHGEIPEAVAMLPNASVLWFPGNSLTGSIPLSLGSSSPLVSLVPTA
jgi:Leucine-rich repeat (LRR) protein